MQVTASRHGFVRFWIIALAVALPAMANILSARADDPPAETKQAAPAKAATADAPKLFVEVFPEPTPQERRLLSALEHPVKLDMKDVPLKEVVAFLRDYLGNELQIQLNYRALEDAGVSGDTPITIQVENISLKSALKLLCEPWDMQYLVHDEYLSLTTQDDAEAHLKTRIYPVADIVGDDYDSLFDVLKTTVSPPSWDLVGGPGTVSPLPAAGSMVISQTQEVHDAVLKLLRGLRAAKRQAAE